MTLPNWCENKVRIWFDKVEDTEKFQEFVTGVDLWGNPSIFCFSKIMPPPDNEWDYDWCTENWGTKWELNADDIGYEGDEECLDYEFNTAWSPPEGIYNALYDWAEANAIDMHIQWFYNESGMEIAGYLRRGMPIFT